MVIGLAPIRDSRAKTESEAVRLTLTGPKAVLVLVKALCDIAIRAVCTESCACVIHFAHIVAPEPAARLIAFARNGS